MTWQTMDTAPKDGTVVDLWVDGERRADCYWRIGEDFGESEDGWCQMYAEASSSFAVLGVPTHWMPLPEDPPA